MHGSVLFFTFAEEAVKDKELHFPKFLGKAIQILLTFKKRFYRQQVSFRLLT